MESTKQKTLSRKLHTIVYKSMIVAALVVAITAQQPIMLIGALCIWLMYHFTKL